MVANTIGAVRFDGAGSMTFFSKQFVGSSFFKFAVSDMHCKVPSILVLFLAVKARCGALSL